MRRQFHLHQLLTMIAAASFVLAVGSQGHPWLALILAAALVTIGLDWWALSPKLAVASCGAYLALILVLGEVSCTLRSARTPSHTTTCGTRLNLIVTLLEQYQRDHGSLPPAYVADADGRPMHSWRVLLLPYLEDQSLWQNYRMNETWDSPNNLNIAGQVAGLFQCPIYIAQGSRQTSFVAVTGPETLWPGETGRSLMDITDAKSSTILLVEWPDSDVCWNEPRDLPADLLPQTVRRAATDTASPADVRGVRVVFADGSTGRLDVTASTAALRAMTTIAGGEAGNED